MRAHGTRLPAWPRTSTRGWRAIRAGPAADRRCAAWRPRISISEAASPGRSRGSPAARPTSVRPQANPESGGLAELLHHRGHVEVLALDADAVARHLERHARQKLDASAGRCERPARRLERPRMRPAPSDLEHHGLSARERVVK